MWSSPRLISALVSTLLLCGSASSQSTTPAPGASGSQLGPLPVGAQVVVLDTDQTIASTAYPNQIIVVRACTLTVDCTTGPALWRALFVTENAVVTHPTGDAQGLQLSLGHLRIFEGSSIDVDRRGHANNQGPGAGASPSNGYNGGGGTFGGRGGDPSSHGLAGSAYGDFALADQIGSGGGSSSNSTGGRGGGRVQLTVAHSARIDGRVSANGMPASVWSSFCGGGGSGGSIYIEAGTLSGDGSIQANGGGTNGPGGGGGGGRIALLYTNNYFFGSIAAYGGVANNAGGAGSYYRRSQVITAGHLLFDNGSIEDGVTHVPGVLNVTGNLDVKSNAILAAPALQHLEIQVSGNFTLGSEGRVNLNKLGYAAN